MVNRFTTTALYGLLVAIMSLGLTLTQANASESAAPQGTWTKFKANTKGGWGITNTDGASYIEFDEAFKTKKAPDLKVLLSPRPIDQVTNRNALEGAVVVTELKSYSGAQRFRLPDGINLADYQSVLIHCEKYTYVWSGGSLK